MKVLKSVLIICCSFFIFIYLLVFAGTFLVVREVKSVGVETKDENQKTITEAKLQIDSNRKSPQNELDEKGKTLDNIEEIPVAVKEERKIKNRSFLRNLTLAHEIFDQKIQTENLTLYCSNICSQTNYDRIKDEKIHEEMLYDSKGLGKVLGMTLMTKVIPFDFFTTFLSLDEENESGVIQDSIMTLKLHALVLKHSVSFKKVMDEDFRKNISNASGLIGEYESLSKKCTNNKIEQQFAVGKCEKIVESFQSYYKIL